MSIMRLAALMLCLALSGCAPVPLVAPDSFSGTCVVRIVGHSDDGDPIVAVFCKPQEGA